MNEIKQPRADFPSWYAKVFGRRVTLVSHGNQKISKPIDPRKGAVDEYVDKEMEKQKMSEIKLPPLPEWIQEQIELDTNYPVSTMITAMRQYAKVAVNQAIKADRQANKTLMHYMPETIAALKATGCNESLVTDIEKAMRGEADRQARSDLISKYQEKVRALEEDNHTLVAETDELKRRGEPVLYQYRRRPHWIGAPKYLSDWITCTKEQADDYRQVKVLDDWEYEVRELYTTPQPQQIPEGLADILREVDRDFCCNTYRFGIGEYPISYRR